MLEDGRIRECDSPQALMTNRRSLFHSMVKCANAKGASYDATS